MIHPNRNPFMKSLLFTSLVLSPILSSAEPWVIDTQENWKSAADKTKGIKIADGFVKPEKEKGHFESVVKSFSEKRKLSSIVFEQSPVWDNWEQIDDITPPGLGNAYVFLPVAPGDYYVFATFRGPAIDYPKGLNRKERQAYKKEYQKKNPTPEREKGYHAWHSTDLK